MALITSQRLLLHFVIYYIGILNGNLAKEKSFLIFDRIQENAASIIDTNFSIFIGDRYQVSVVMTVGEFGSENGRFGIEICMKIGWSDSTPAVMFVR